jgi:hypothetical protein
MKLEYKDAIEEELESVLKMSIKSEKLRKV